MRLHRSLRGPALNVYSTGHGCACGRAGRVRNPRTRKQPMEWGNEDRALIFGDGSPVPEDNCDGAMRARLRNSECAATSKKT
jgi:hypothetical protein